MYIAVPTPKATTPLEHLDELPSNGVGLRKMGEGDVHGDTDEHGVEDRAEPGRTPSGIHSRSRAKPTMTITVPTAMPVCRLMPLCSTSHGARPMSPAMMRAIPMPQIVSPTTHCRMRTVNEDGIVREHGSGTVGVCRRHVLATDWRDAATKASNSACCAGSLAAVSSGCHCTPTTHRSGSSTPSMTSPTHAVTTSPGAS